MTFGGSTYDEALDGSRLRQQLERVKKYLLEARGAWVSLQDCPAALEGEGTAAITARARDLRKEKHGCYAVECRRNPIAKQGYQYRILWDGTGPVRYEAFGRKGTKPTGPALKEGLDQLRWVYQAWLNPSGTPRARLEQLEALLAWLES